MEPISDDDLQRLRRQTVTLEDAGYVTGTYRIKDFVRLFARLDAAESRVAELQEQLSDLAYDAIEQEISMLSEEFWCAGWHIGCEFVFFADMKNGKYPRLARLYEQAGGWVHWDSDAKDRVRIAAAEWEAVFNKWNER